MTFPHLTDGTPCWCQPDTEDHDGGTLVIHRDTTVNTDTEPRAMSYMLDGPPAL
jgi:hypothetical protein